MCERVPNLSFADPKTGSLETFELREGSIVGRSWEKKHRYRNYLLMRPVFPYLHFGLGVLGTIKFFLLVAPLIMRGIVEPKLSLSLSLSQCQADISPCS